MRRQTAIVVILCSFVVSADRHAPAEEPPRLVQRMNLAGDNLIHMLAPQEDYPPYWWGVRQVLSGRPWFSAF